MIGLSNRTVIVTGASRGLGFSIAKVLAGAGASVAIADLDPEAAADAAKTLHTSGARCLGIDLDLGDSRSIDRAVGRTIDRFGRLDIVVNNAGIFQARLGLDVDESDFARILDINTVGVWRMIKATLPYLRASRGKVVNVASNGALQPVAFAPAYCASKAALLSLTRSLALLLGSDGVQVNAVCPGPVETDMLAEIQALRVERECEAPLARTAALDGTLLASDIGEAVAFLASDLARNITGQALVIDRGVVMH